MYYLKKMKLTLVVENVNAAADYYEKVLGFEVAATLPQAGRYTWAIVRHDAVEIMFQAKELASTEEPSSSFLVHHIPMPDVETFYNRIKDQVAVVRALYPTFYGGKEFAIRDCNGLILAFAEGAA